jgi:hypothetical protein
MRTRSKGLGKSGRLDKTALLKTPKQTNRGKKRNSWSTCRDRDLNHLVAAIKCRKINVIASTCQSGAAVKGNRRLLTERVLPFLCNHIVTQDVSFVEAIVLDLVRIGFNCNQGNGHGRTLLHYLMKFNCRSLLHTLTTAGVQLDWNRKDISGFTPLMHSCHSGHHDLLLFVLQRQLAVQKVAGVEGLVAMCIQHNMHGLLESLLQLLGTHTAPVFWQKELKQSIPHLWKHGDAETFQIIDQAIDIDYNSDTKDGRTALMESSLYGNHVLFKLLLKQGVCDANAVCPNGSNALMYACLKQISYRHDAYSEIIQILLQKHYSTGVPDRTSIYSALIITAKKKFWAAMMQILGALETADPTTVDWKPMLNNVLFHKALAMANPSRGEDVSVIPPSLMHTLCRHGMDPNLLLNALVMEGRIKEIETMLQNKSLHPSREAVTRAIARGSTTLLALFIQHNAEITFDVGCSFSRSLVDRNLHLAMAYRHGSEEMIQLVSSNLKGLSNFIQLQNLHSALFAEHSIADRMIGLHKQQSFGPTLCHLIQTVLTLVIRDFATNDHSVYIKIGSESEIATLTDQEAYRVQLSENRPFLNRSESAYRLTQQVIESVIRVTDIFGSIESLFKAEWKTVRKNLMARIDHITNGLPSCVLTRDTTEPSTPSCCTICIEPMHASTNNVKLACSHRFHRACLDSWFRIKDTCPICRNKS